MPKGREQKSRSVCEAPVATNLRKTVQSLGPDDFRKLLEGALEPEYQRRSRRASTTEGDGKPEFVLNKLKEEVEEEDRRRREEREAKQRIRDAIAPRSKAYEGPMDDIEMIDDGDNAESPPESDDPMQNMEEGRAARLPQTRDARRGNTESHAQEWNNDVEMQLFQRRNGGAGEMGVNREDADGTANEDQMAVAEMNESLRSLLMPTMSGMPYFAALPRDLLTDSGQRNNQPQLIYRQFTDNAFENTRMKNLVTKESDVDPSRRPTNPEANMPCTVDHIKAVQRSKGAGKGSKAVTKAPDYEIRNSLWQSQTIDQIVEFIKGPEKTKTKIDKTKNKGKNKQQQQQPSSQPSSPPSAQAREPSSEKESPNGTAKRPSSASSAISPPPPPPPSSSSSKVVWSTTLAAAQGKQQQEKTTQPTIGANQSGGAVVVTAPQQSARATFKTTTSTNPPSEQQQQQTKKTATGTVGGGGAPPSTTANPKAKGPPAPAPSTTKGGKGKEQPETQPKGGKKETRKDALKMEEERARSRISPNSSGSRSSMAGRPSSDDQDEEFVSCDEAPPRGQRNDGDGRASDSLGDENNYSFDDLEIARAIKASAEEDAFQPVVKNKKGAGANKGPTSGNSSNNHPHHSQQQQQQYSHHPHPYSHSGDRRASSSSNQTGGGGGQGGPSSAPTQRREMGKQSQPVYRNQQQHAPQQQMQGTRPSSSSVGSMSGGGQRQKPAPSSQPSHASVSADGSPAHAVRGGAHVNVSVSSNSTSSFDTPSQSRASHDTPPMMSPMVSSSSDDVLVSSAGGPARFSYADAAKKLSAANSRQGSPAGDASPPSSTASTTGGGGGTTTATPAAASPRGGGEEQAASRPPPGFQPRSAKQQQKEKIKETKDEQGSSSSQPVPPHSSGPAPTSDLSFFYDDTLQKQQQSVKNEDAAVEATENQQQPQPQQTTPKNNVLQMSFGDRNYQLADHRPTDQSMSDSHRANVDHLQFHWNDFQNSPGEVVKYVPKNRK